MPAREPEYAAVGDLTWYARGGPALTLSETCRLLGGASVTLCGDVWARLTRRFRDPPAYVAIDDPSLVETEASLAATAWARTQLPRDIYDHSERTVLFSIAEWLLGGGRDGPFGDLDLEALRIAGRFHDATLHQPASAGHGCFTVSSADAAAAFAREHGVTGERVDQIVSAITANPSPGVTRSSHGSVAAVLSAGGLDEMLHRAYRLHPKNLSEIAAAHPWNDFHRRAREHMRRQRKLYPGSRFACTGPLLEIIMWLGSRHRQ